MSEQAQPETGESATAVTRTRRGLLRRFGCGLILALWFLLLLTPCALFYLAANGEIRLFHADIPRPYSQPRLLISLINDVENRGLQIVRSIPVRESDDTAVCVETVVNYLLWASSEGNQDVTYCDCYERADATSSWNLGETRLSSCE
ncbi:MAG: hypothetical protein OXG78_00925 [Chloroflexi bacterium]|nr:hypothetical protein [Chloroflexota bacterium]